MLWSSNVIAEDVPNPTSLVCYEGGVFVAATPNILYIKPGGGGSTNVVRQVVFSGWTATNSPSTSTGLLHSLQWGLDNRIYGGAAGLSGNISQPGTDPVYLEETDFSFDPRNHRLQPETGTAGSGMTFDHWGNRFVCDAERPLRRPMYEYRHMLLNPYVPWPHPMEEVLTPPAPVFRLVEGAGTSGGTTPTAGPNRAERTEAARLGHARSIVFYQGDLFPTNYRGNVFIVDSEQRLIHRAALREKGLQVSAARVAEDGRSEFLSSTEATFRPVFLANGPDGALYLADMGVAAGQGRILRIAPEKAKTGGPQRLGSVPVRDLVTALAHPNGWRRQTAARLLYERRDLSAVQLLTNMVVGARAPLARMHALGALAGLSALAEGHVLQTLKHTDAHVREHALRLLENPPPGGLSPALANQLKSLAADPSPAVRKQLVPVLARLRHPEKSALLLHNIKRLFLFQYY